MMKPTSIITRRPLPRRLVASIAAGILALLPSNAFAHETGLVLPSELGGWSTFLPDPLTSVAVVLALFVYTRGATRSAPPVGRRIAFSTGMLVLLVAVSPGFDATAYALLSVHMLQHLILIVVSAPLLAYSRPLAPLILGLPRPFRIRSTRSMRPLRIVGAPIARPIGALVLASAVLWLWHAPVLYQAALHHSSLHVMEHALFLATSVLFWATLLPSTRRARSRSPGSVLVLFAMSLQGALLGALLAFSSTLWFEHYATTSAHWGLSAMDDQLAAGLLMWMVGGVVYGAAAAVLLATGLAEMESRMQRQSRSALTENTLAQRRSTHEV